MRHRGELHDVFSWKKEFATFRVAAISALCVISLALIVLLPHRAVHSGAEVIFQLSCDSIAFNVCAI